MIDHVEGAAAPTKKLAWWQWVIALVALVGGGAQILRGIETFSLPACDSSTTLDTLRGIFAGQKAPLSSIANAKLVSDTDKRRDCSAYVASANEKAQITYHVFWDGWSKGVMVDKVTPVAVAPGQG